MSNSYPPKHHQEYNSELIQQVALQYPFATLVSANSDEPYITHAPLILENNKLIGHIDASNPHVSLLKNNNKAVAIFNGPQSYISPSVYTTKQLPTWNYLIAHGYGLVTAITDPLAIKKSLVTMTEYMEGTTPKFVLDLEDPRMDRLVPYIHCFELNIQRWEGKFKISQDKSIQDIDNAKQQLIKSNQASIKDFIDSLFAAHFSH
ncbi:FMN-binding negative transcriptional regulator [Aquimarina brevivitae]|uniref:PaiB family negative transcriptional regulator n=1 Tax=Aquimarina brevivitae TaxID=323412 RepID=A0A4Q7PJB6_9FLAO|nr:FMN-binding negative transcriptional regulator [Aquimarina brevivitae]RZS99930.1 PaiB family negative transcriptional regulator [Aquimarina brevivitae]